MKNADVILYEFLVETDVMNNQEYTELLEDTKNAGIKEIAQDLLFSLNNKLSNIKVDTVDIDKSRGDIKQLKALDSIQVAITKLQKMLTPENYSIFSNKEIIGYLNDIVKTILYLNQYSKQFKNAYRLNKSILILKYESMILAIISSLSYIISVCIDFNTPKFDLKKKINISEIAPLKTIKDFNTSVETGELSNILKDSDFLREYFIEYSAKEMSTIYEAEDIMSMVSTGLTNMYKELNKNGQLTNLLYKATAVINLLFSMRNVIYTLSRIKNSALSALNNIKGFATNYNSYPMTKTKQYNNQFPSNIEVASTITSNEISDENKSLGNKIKEISNAPILGPAGDNNEKIPTSASDLFNF